MALRRRVRPWTEGMWVGMEIERGTAVLWRGPGVVQIGSDPDHHLVLGGLSPAEQVWLVEAARAATPTGAHTTPTPRPSRRRAAPGRAPTPVAARVAAHLRARGVLPHTAAPGPRPNPRMRIDGVDVISAATARILVRSGVERLDIVDPARLDRPLPGVFDEEDVGVPRAQALAHHLQDLGSLTVAPLTSPDVVLVSRARVPGLATAAALGAENRLHLLVTRHEGSVEIGPLVAPGRTPCAQCRALHLADADPHWPLTAREMPSWPLPPALDLAVEGVASLEVARAMLAALGSTELGPSALVRTEGRTLLRVEAGGVVREVPCPPHPRCSCGAFPHDDAHRQPTSSVPGDGAPAVSGGASPRTTARMAAP